MIISLDSYWNFVAISNNYEANPEKYNTIIINVKRLVRLAVSKNS